MPEAIPANYDFDTEHKYAAVVHLYVPIPRLAEQLVQPSRIVEFDWEPDHVEVILIAGTQRYELDKLAQNIAHQHMEKPYDPEDRDAGARAWWASRPGPDSSDMTFMEWRDARPSIVWKVETVATSAYVKAES